MTAESDVWRRRPRFALDFLVDFCAYVFVLMVLLAVSVAGGMCEVP